MARLKKSITTDIIDSKLNNTKTLIIVVDMINGFVVSGSMADAAISNIIEPHLQLFKTLNNAPHLYFVDAHDDDCKEFASFPLHCLKDSFESEVIDELKEDSLKSTIIYKNSTNGFLSPSFINNIDNFMEYDNFVVTGCCTDICVMQFALTLQTYINEHDYNKNIFLVVDAVDTYHNDVFHDAYLYNEMSLNLMKQAGICLVNLKGDNNE